MLLLLSAAINLKPDFAASFMYLAITLARLEDFDNACSAYEKVVCPSGTSQMKYFSSHLPPRSDVVLDTTASRSVGQLWAIERTSYFSLVDGLARPQALDLDGDYLTHLNYAVTLLNNDEPERATDHFRSFKKLFKVQHSQNTPGIDTKCYHSRQFYKQQWRSTMTNVVRIEHHKARNG